MNDDARAVAHALTEYARHEYDDEAGFMEKRLEYEQATAILRENDGRNKPGRYDPLTDYESVLSASACALDYLATALSTATNRTRVEIYTDLHQHIIGLPASGR